MRKAFYFSALIACALTFSLPAVAQNSDLKTAYALCTSGKYAEAAELFKKAVAGPAKNNAMAHYYLATCLMQLGKTSDARNSYRSCLALNPPAAIASYCHRALGTQPAGATSAVVSGTTNSIAVRTPGRRAGGGGTPAAIDPADKELLSVHRHTGDTDQIYNTVMSALASIPRGFKDEVKNGGCKILICPTINEANPHLATEKPSGYIHGGGYDNCPGMFYGGTKILYIAERASWQNSPPQLNHMAACTTAHEFGHAYDFVKHDISSSGEFERRYSEDYGRLTNSQRTEWQYYCQENGGERGRAELFAELFAITHGTGIDRGSGALAQVFPKCYEYMQNMKP